MASKSSSRPPTGRSKSAPGPSAEALRKQLVQAEVQLREVEEEARRVAMHQERELEMIENDNKVYMDQLEILRMEECSTPAELEALRIGTGAPSSSGAAAGGAPVSSRLLASTSVKYRTARDTVVAKRAECSEAEAQLAAAKHRFAELRKLRRDHDQAAQRTMFETAAREMYVTRTQGQSREQLRGLEVHVVAEQERLSSTMTDAKKMRADIDTLLIHQSRFERSYRNRENDLLEKRKEMSFLVEVCILMLEEREGKRRELEELKSLAQVESSKYEAALDELDAVLVENTKKQLEMDDKIAELRHDIHACHKQRVQAERETADASKDLQKKRDQMKQQLALDGPRASGDADDGGADGGLAIPAGDTDSGDDVGTAMQQMKQFEMFYKRLAALVGSDRFEDVIAYTETSAEERFHLFSELNYLQDETARLEKEAAELEGVPAEAEQKPTSLLLASANASNAGDDDDDEEGEGKDAATAMAMATLPDFSKEVTSLQRELDVLKLQNVEQGEEKEALDRTYDQVVRHVRQAFRALNCDMGVIQQSSGASRVLRSNLTDCLALIDQRVEEYLLALARASQSGHLVPHESHRSPQEQQASQSVARTFLRRADLPPPIGSDSSVMAAFGTGRGGSGKRASRRNSAAAVLSRSGAGGGAGRSVSMSARQIVQLQKKALPRSVDPHPAALKTSTRPRSPSSTLLGNKKASALKRPPSGMDANVEDDKPLSVEEMRRIVQERQQRAAGNTASLMDNRRFQ